MSSDDAPVTTLATRPAATASERRFQRVRLDAEDLARRDGAVARLSATLIVNPHAAGVDAPIERIVHNALSDRFDVEAIATHAPGHAREIAAAASAAGQDVVIVLGGDGTVSDAANALSGSETALACLPGGSANVFVKILGLPSDLVDATAHLLALADAWHWRELRLGTVNGRLFTFAAGLGLDASVTRYVDARPRLKARYGPWFFAWGATVAFTREYLRHAPRLRARVNGRTLEGVTALVQNAATYTYFHDHPITFANGADLRTPALAGCVLRRGNLLDVPSIAVRAISTRASVAGHRQIDSFGPVATLEVATADGRPLPLQADGDFLGLVDGARFGVSDSLLRIVA